HSRSIADQAVSPHARGVAVPHHAGRHLTCDEVCYIMCDTTLHILGEEMADLLRPPARPIRGGAGRWLDDGYAVGEVDGRGCSNRRSLTSMVHRRPARSRAKESSCKRVVAMSG